MGSKVFKFQSLKFLQPLLIKSIIAMSVVLLELRVSQILCFFFIPNSTQVDEPWAFNWAVDHSSYSSYVYHGTLHPETC